MGGSLGKTETAHKVAKEDLGTKRLCPNCGARYYDMNKTPAVCPKCGTVFEVVASKPRPQPAPKAPVETPKEEPPAAAPEVISLEEADAELTGTAKKADGDGEEKDLEAADEEDDPFLEVDDDDEDDVTGIVVGNTKEDL